MVRLRVLFGAMMGMGSIGLGVGIELGQQSRNEGQAVVASLLPVCSVESPVLMGYGASPNNHRGKTIRIARFKVEFAPPAISGDIGSELTEAVVKAIEQKTPYKVETTSDADMELRGVIKSFCQTSRDYNQGQLNGPCETETTLLVEVSWRDLRKGESLLKENEKEISSKSTLKSVAYYRPEIGESPEQARKVNVERMADSIIFLLKLSQ